MIWQSFTGLLLSPLVWRMLKFNSQWFWKYRQTDIVTPHYVQQRHCGIFYHLFGCSNQLLVRSVLSQCRSHPALPAPTSCLAVSSPKWSKIFARIQHTKRPQGVPTFILNKPEKHLNYFLLDQLQSLTLNFVHPMQFFECKFLKNTTRHFS